MLYEPVSFKFGRIIDTPKVDRLILVLNDLDLH